MPLTMLQLLFLTALSLALAETENRTPAWKGLPPFLSTELEPGFMEYSGIPTDGDGAPDTPLSEEAVPLPEGFLLKDVFTSDHWVRIPPSSVIFTHKDRQDRTIWNYPVGTELIHRIFLNEREPKLFEVRMIKKITDRKWAFALYAKDGEGKLRRHEDGSPDLQFKVQTLKGSVPIQMKRLHPESCRHCHWMDITSPSAFQFESPDEAGPCGFGPTNEHLKKEWAPKYQSKQGYWPFITRTEIIEGKPGKPHP